jgi:hypothetical protein
MHSFDNGCTVHEEYQQHLEDLFFYCHKNTVGYVTTNSFYQ